MKLRPYLGAKAKTLLKVRLFHFLKPSAAVGAVYDRTFYVLATKPRGHRPRLQFSRIVTRVTSVLDFGVLKL